MNLSLKNITYFVRAILTIMGLLAYFIPLQAQTGQRFKQIDYTYDLISGKVNEVHYQASQPDAFYHRYEYDADNRITKVYTSKDSVIWDNDARYVYYAHGPLARAEFGDNNVQGMDYAYNLQGWIKGVNSNLLQAENDMGDDGLTGSTNSLVAKDAYGYTLNYHTDDYKPIDGPKWSNTVQRFEALTPGSDLMASRFDLFNGNISSMVTTIEEPKVYTGAPNEIPNILPQGTAYQYDQLNRLLEMKAFQNLDVATNTWQQDSIYAGLYHNAFKYDANGNILYQERADQNGMAFDKMTYQYKTDASGKRLQNRLYHVNDGNNNTTIATDDIEDQGAFTPSPTSPISINDVNNYRYDEIGNLKHDTQEGIEKIEWTVYGKIKRITRTPGNLRSDLEFLYDASGNRIAKIEKPRDAGGVKPPSDWITTYYTRDAQGNVMGIYKLTAITTGPSFKVVERHVYGSSRLGSDYSEVEMVGASALSNPIFRILGNKHFEGSNHLGNVLEVFSDRKIARDDNGDEVVDYFQPEVVSANDYSPFGVVLDGRDFGVGGRYGFNGKERDDEVKRGGNSLDFGARVYDSRLGRFTSLDGKASQYPGLSPFTYVGNMPTIASDPDGNVIEIVVGKTKITYQPGMVLPKNLAKNPDLQQIVNMLDVIDKAVGSDFDDVISDPKVLTLMINTEEPSTDNNGESWHYIPEIPSDYYPELSSETSLNVIEIDPKLGSQTTYEGGEQFEHSPTTNLAHEIGHFFLGTEKGKKKKPSNEHDYIIPNWENVVVDYMNETLGGNEGKRTPAKGDGKGYDYKTKGPTTTDPDISTETGKQANANIEKNKQ